MNMPAKPGAVSRPQQPVARTEAQRPGAQRGRPDNLGGPKLKLNVPEQIPGYKLQWTNDEDGGIEALLAEGFEFVTREEVGIKGMTRSAVVEGKDVDSRYSKYVGSRRDGSALLAFLLKCPDEIWEEREAMKQRQADRWDDAIYTGKPNEVESGHSYSPEGYKSELKTR